MVSGDATSGEPPTTRIRAQSLLKIIIPVPHLELLVVNVYGSSASELGAQPASGATSRAARVQRSIFKGKNTIDR